MAHGSTSPMPTTIGGHGLKNLRFTQFLTPGVLKGEQQASSQELSRYTNIRSKWTRELLEYRDALERRDVAKAAHAALEQSLQSAATKRLRQKRRALEVPLVEPPAGMRPPTLLSPGDGTPGSVGDPPRSAHSAPRERSHSPGVYPISAGPPTKLLEELYPHAARRFQQLLASASMAEVEGRLNKAQAMEMERTAEAMRRDEARLAKIDHSRTVVQGRQLERAKALQADWAKRYGHTLNRRTQQEQQAQVRQLEEIQSYNSDAEAEAKRQADLRSAPSRVLEQLEKVQQRRQALEEEQEERTAEGVRQKEALLAASNERRERDRELHRQWLQGLKADWEDTSATGQQRRQEAVERIKEEVRLYAERVHSGDHEDHHAPGPGRNQQFLQRVPQVLEAGEELRRRRQERWQQGIRAKDHQRETHLQELQEELQARYLDQQRHEEEKTAMAAFMRETQGEQQRQRYTEQLAGSLAEAEQRRVEFLQKRAEDIRARSKDFRRLEVREADVKSSEDLQLQLQEKEARRLEALQEAERERLREEEEEQKAGRRNPQERFEAVLARCAAKERRRIRHEEEVYRRKVQQIEAFRQKKTQEASEKPAHLPAKDNAALMRTLDYLNLMEQQTASRRRQLEEKDTEIEQHHRRRDAHLQAVAIHTVEVRIPKPERPDMELEAAELRAAYAMEVQEREARLQALQATVGKKREEAVTEVTKRRELNSERHGELRDARMARLLEAEQEEDRRLQAFEEKKQAEAQDRTQHAALLTQQRRARQELSVLQEVTRRSAVEAEAEWRHSPRKRAAGWFHGPLGPLRPNPATPS